jgi:hypothetical protein
MATSDKNGNNTWLKELRKEKIKQRNLVSDEQINIATLEMRKQQQPSLLVPSKLG